MRKPDYSIVGKRFGKLTVLELDHVEPNGLSHWLCKCDCGRTRVVSRVCLLRGITTTCTACRRHLDDFLGRRFGKLTVLELDHTDKHRNSYWLCECDCGNTRIVSRQNLLNGAVTCCSNCYDNIEDLTGLRFGRLTVIDFDRFDERRASWWLCECDCGNEISVRRNSLVSGQTKSCGCYSRDIHTSHGMTKTRLYRIWSGIKTRCENESDESYHRYGERGIDVCSEWESFETFRDWALDNGYEDNLTIDRIDNNLGYYPENCRWADRVTQQNNKRNNIYVEYEGERHTIGVWARILDIKYSTLYRRVKRGDMRDFEEHFDRRV